MVEWAQEQGHGLYCKFLQVQHTSTIEWLHFTYRLSNTKWYQEMLTSKAGFPIACRYRKIAGSSSREHSALHVEVGSAHLQRAKQFMRTHFSKHTEPPFFTGFPVYYIPDKNHIVNSHSRSGAAIVIARQLALLKN